MLNDILPFNHIAALNNYFKIMDHLADGKLPRNYDDTGNLFRSGDPDRSMIRHCASVVRNENPLLVCRPRLDFRIGSITEADLMGRYDIQVWNTK